VNRDTLANIVEYILRKKREIGAKNGGSMMLITQDNQESRRGREVLQRSEGEDNLPALSSSVRERHRALFERNLSRSIREHPSCSI
jgi:hypothetical protein